MPAMYIAEGSYVSQASSFDPFAVVTRLSTAIQLHALVQITPLYSSLEVHSWEKLHRKKSVPTC